MASAILDAKREGVDGSDQSRHQTGRAEPSFVGSVYKNVYIYLCLISMSDHLLRRDCDRMYIQNLCLPSMALPFAAGVGRDPEFEMEQTLCSFSL